MRRGVKVFWKDTGIIKAQSIKIMNKIRNVDNMGGLYVLKHVVDELADEYSKLVEKMKNYN